MIQRGQKKAHVTHPYRSKMHLEDKKQNFNKKKQLK